MKELQRQTAIETMSEPDLIDRIAKEIGKEVVSHIQNMYPEAASAVAWKSCARSIEGVVRNKISAV